MASWQLVSFDPFALLCDARGAPFADARVTQHLGRMMPLAAILREPHDPRALEALRTLEQRVGMRHDLVLTAGAELAGEGRRKHGVAPERWLHVTTAPGREPWLDAARAVGVRVVCMPRGGLDDPMALDQAVARGEMRVLSDFWQLATEVEATNGGPLRYEVRAHAANREVLERFVHWMRYEHGADLLAVRGCLSFEIVQESDLTLRNEYLFVNKAAFDDYVSGEAVRLREKGRERFRETEVRFERAETRLLGGFGGRERRNFP